MANTGTLLLAGVTILPNNQPDFSKVPDIFMMTIGGGKRTESEFRKLLGKAGFQSLRSTPTESMLPVHQRVNMRGRIGFSASLPAL